MRISDWSSDVCSSDLQIDRLATPERVLLTVASACGASCSAAAVAAGAEVAVNDVESVLGALTRQNLFVREQIGRASGRERVCQVRVDLGGRRLSNKKNS